MDGNGITTTWSYDALNRPVSVTRSGTGNTISPTITRCYDGLVATADFTCTTPTTAISQAHGRLTSSRANTPAGSFVSTTTYSQYDELGRVGASQQTTNGLAPFSFSYGYDLADHIMQETYPSGRVVETAYNFAEQPTGISGTWNGSFTQYALNASYAAFGGVGGMTLNCGTTRGSCGSSSWNELWAYNSRLRVTSMTWPAVSLGYGYSTTADNGNVASHTVTRGRNKELLLRRRGAARAEADRERGGNDVCLRCGGRVGGGVGGSGERLHNVLRGGGCAGVNAGDGRWVGDGGGVP